jgi:putative tryptophan/tyrosine transport system substrate-binding protein
MRRREFIRSIGGAAIAWPLAVRAQQKTRMPVVGVVFAATRVTEMLGANPVAPPARGFAHGLRDLGWIDGANLTIERRSAEGDPQRAPSIFAELLAHGVDVLMVGGVRWLQDAAQRATREVPTVTDFSEDPVAAGLIASLARPGGNLTGVTQTTGPEFYSKQLELLREMAPRMSRAAFLGPQRQLELYRAAVHPTGVAVIPVLLDVRQQYEDAFATVIREQADALLLGGSPVSYTELPRVVKFAADNSLPTIYPYREAVEAGGLMSYGSNTEGRFRQAARLVDRILKGAQPQDVPTEQPTTFELIVNRKTANALKLTVPNTLLVSADEVIE